MGSWLVSYSYTRPGKLNPDKMFREKKKEGIIDNSNDNKVKFEGEKIWRRNQQYYVNVKGLEERQIKPGWEAHNNNKTPRGTWFEKKNIRRSILDVGTSKICIYFLTYIVMDKQNYLSLWDSMYGPGDYNAK